MGVNKVVYENTVLVDLTGDTVTSDKLVKDVTAHDKSGNVIVGSHTCITPNYIAVHTGSTDPSNTIGDEGDLYIKLV